MKFIDWMRSWQVNLGKGSYAPDRPIDPICFNSTHQNFEELHRINLKLMEALEFYGDWRTYKGVVAYPYLGGLSEDFDLGEQENKIYGKKARAVLRGEG